MHLECHSLYGHGNSDGVERVRECAATGRVEMGLALMIPQVRDTWLTRVTPNS